MTNNDLALQSIADSYVEGLRAELVRIGWAPPARILVVVDDEISTSPTASFGIRRMIDTVRNADPGSLSFRIDIARRSAGPPVILPVPDAGGAKYTGFRFDMLDSNGTAPLLHRYKQVWCFGFKPDNFGGPDTNIDNPSAFPASDGELAVLANWMEVHKGGVFATGDHDYLGASMCHRIPRVGTMRRWTNADGVPPIGTPDRIDTLRPGSEPLGNATDQEDVVPQPIRWVTWSSLRVGVFRRIARPHPVLCHPKLGPIDVMPDHAHEGLCFDDSEVVLDRTFDFDGNGEKPEYPLSPGGIQVRPRVIAYGSTLSSDDFDFEKGPQPFRSSFPMISVYDGHRAGVGRVAVDSTWHHWMNINIDEMAAADGPTWQKISQYYINLAAWLNPPQPAASPLIENLIISHFGYAGLQEYSPRMTTQELGTAFRAQLLGFLGPCWVTQWVLDWLVQLDPRRFVKVFDLEVMPVAPDGPWPPFPDPCLSCPPVELIEDMVLGGLVRSTLTIAAEFRAQFAAGESPRGFSVEVFDKLARRGTFEALKELGKTWSASLERAQESVRPFL